MNRQNPVIKAPYTRISGFGLGAFREVFGFQLHGRRRASAFTILGFRLGDLGFFGFSGLGFQGLGCESHALWTTAVDHPKH